MLDLKKRRQWRDLSESSLGWWLLLPSFLLLALIVVYPIGRLLVNSFSNYVWQMRLMQHRHLLAGVIIRIFGMTLSFGHH